MAELRKRLYNQLCAVTAIDVHSHLAAGQLQSARAADLLLYHMVRYPLRAADVAEDILWKSEKLHHAGEVSQSVLDAWPAVRYTGFGRMAERIFSEMYGVTEEPSASSWARIEAAHAARSAQPGWGGALFARYNLCRVLSSTDKTATVLNSNPRVVLQPTIESSPLGTWREYMPWADRLSLLEKRTGCKVCSAAAMRAAVKTFYDRFDFEKHPVLVAWVSAMIDFSPVSDTVIDVLLKAASQGEALDSAQTAVLDAALLRMTCEAVNGRVATVQLCYGCQFLSGGRPHPVQRAGRFAATFALLAAAFPGIHFNILNGYEPDEPLLCALTLGYANISLAGFWWHTFYPSVMHRALQRRLDMVPLSRLCGFFSDGWCAEWTCARLDMTRQVLAGVLDERINAGLMDEQGALGVARALLNETPARLFPAEAG